MKVGDKLEIKSVELVFTCSGTGQEQWRDPESRLEVFSGWNRAEAWLKQRQKSRGDAHLEISATVGIRGFEDPFHHTLMDADWKDIDLPTIKKKLEDKESSSAKEIAELYQRRSLAEGNFSKLRNILSGIDTAFL
ncbi:MAG: hypothetical protein UY40_C0014G0011 [candidate division CPR1 bacterium GW2011_GWC1_49_13]|uniref:Uncharacterized protein n=1 Tax=candidate division CPR1 bacterium GW2011_GWC1_49_13 TaxID=1618342 RepID=A0A0G1YGR7_9BACT|nr:MAG: hypothetical protein UY40_C0014G0011 [candidate division CPR1 bacterium GW2011_GWC1_49_13]